MNAAAPTEPAVGVRGITREEALHMRPGPYQKTHEFPGDYINDAQCNLATMPLKDGTSQINHPIRGSMRRGDAAKIYELAYFANGPVADIGTNWGLSAAIAGMALRDAGVPYLVHTVDLEPKMLKRATANFQEHALVNITTYCSEAAEWLEGQKVTGNRFSFVFVDHSHNYGPVKAVCQRLANVMVPGGYVAFHDFFSRRNLDPKHHFAVVQGVMDGLDQRFSYSGASGCVAVYRLTE